MDIEKASDMGFCFGVRRAIELVEKASEEHGSLRTLGAIVHNRQVVDKLEKQGIGVAQSLDEVQGGAVAITSHGVGIEVINQAKAKGLEIVDATCPFVRKAQNAAQKLSEEGFTILIFGDADHPEIRGVLGWAGDNAYASSKIPEFDIWPKKLGILCQTTQTNAAFGNFITKIVSSHIDQISELRVYNTICDSTRKHQAAALDVAKRVDLMLVIGGRNSANTTRLAEICAEAGVTTHHIESAVDIDASWLRGLNRVGITAGASTPDEIVDEVVRALKY